MSLAVTITAETGRAFVPFVRENLVKAHRATPSRGTKLRGMSVALVGDARMGELHEEFMGIHGPTDVLTFSIDENASGAVTSGEVVVCVPEAKRQAAVRKIPPRHEVLLYAIHGMLHLLGYDDRTPRDFQLMHRTEDEILTKLGFGPVFSAEGAAR